MKLYNNISHPFPHYMRQKLIHSSDINEINIGTLKMIQFRIDQHVLSITENILSM